VFFAAELIVDYRKLSVFIEALNNKLSTPTGFLFYNVEILGNQKGASHKPHGNVDQDGAVV
jgi:hypothetical protein